MLTVTVWNSTSPGLPPASSKSINVFVLPDLRNERGMWYLTNTIGINTRIFYWLFSKMHHKNRVGKIIKCGATQRTISEQAHRIRSYMVCSQRICLYSHSVHRDLVQYHCMRASNGQGCFHWPKPHPFPDQMYPSPPDLSRAVLRMWSSNRRLNKNN